MVFVRYFLRRFIIAFLSIALILAFLLNIVEFFEKIVRVSHTTIGTIAHFVVLNFLPTFSDLMPIASWLAACLVIREFCHQKEWESLLLLSIDSTVLLKLFVLAGCVVTSGALIFREQVTIPLSHNAEQFRNKEFKRATPTITTKTWYKFSDTDYCYIGFLDMNTQKGEDLLMIHLRLDGTIHTSIRTPYFEILPEKESLMMKQGITYDIETGESHIISENIIFVPGLFLRLALQRDFPTLKNLSQKLLSHQGNLSTDAYAALTQALFERLFFYIQILFFPALSLVLFSILINFYYAKWITLLLIYPLFIVISVSIFFLTQKYFSVWIFTFPFILIFLILIPGFLILKRSRKA